MARTAVSILTAGTLIVCGCGGGSGGGANGGGGNGGNGAPPPPAEAQYAIADLGTLGGTTSEATDLNDEGQVVGIARTDGDAANHAFVWDGTTMTDLGTLSGRDSGASGINANGTVVGWSHVPPDNARHGFIYQGTTMTDLTAPDTGGAEDINDAGLVVGQSGDHAYLYDGTTMTDLGTLGGATSRAQAINEGGVIVGWSRLADGTTDHAMRYANGTMGELGTLGGTTSLAYGINDAGHLVGNAQTAAEETGWPIGHAFRWCGIMGIDMEDLGTLGGDRSHAHDINNGGLVIGEAEIASGTLHAFVHDGDQMIDLNDRLADGSAQWTLTSARAVNEAGQIVGQGTNPDGDSHAYLATPQ